MKESRVLWTESLSRKYALNFIGIFMDQEQALRRRKGPKPFSSRNAPLMVHKKPMKTMESFETDSEQAHKIVEEIETPTEVFELYRKILSTPVGKIENSGRALLHDVLGV